MLLSSAVMLTLRAFVFPPSASPPPTAATRQSGKSSSDVVVRGAGPGAETVLHNQTRSRQLSHLLPPSFLARGTHRIIEAPRPLTTWVSSSESESLVISMTLESVRARGRAWEVDAVG